MYFTKLKKLTVLVTYSCSIFEIFGIRILLKLTQGDGSGTGYGVLQREVATKATVLLLNLEEF